jgi:hypothetical protein
MLTDSEKEYIKLQFENFGSIYCRSLKLEETINFLRSIDTSNIYWMGCIIRTTR